MVFYVPSELILLSLTFCFDINLSLSKVSKKERNEKLRKIGATFVRMGCRNKKELSSMPFKSEKTKEVEKGSYN